jgi:uncharacterized protein (DUF302 family)
MIHEDVVILTTPFDESLETVKAAFAEEGFGTLTEIDLQATLRKKIDKHMGRYTIIGACNPNLAGRAVDIVPQIGVLLPCNVVVRETADGVTVEAMDPGLMASVTGSDDMAPIAEEARRLVGNALQRLRSEQAE